MIVEVEARCYAATCSVLGRVEEHSLQQVNLAEEGGEAGGGVRCGKGIGEDLWEEWERHPVRLAASSFGPSSLAPARRWAPRRFLFLRAPSLLIVQTQWSLASGPSLQPHTLTRHTAPRARPPPRPGGKEMRRWDSKGGTPNTYGRVQ